MARLDLNVQVNTSGLNKMRDIGRNMTIGVTLPIIGAGAAVLNLAAEAEKSQKRLQRAFDSMGAASFTTVEEIEANVQSLQKASTFGDEAIRDAAATLLTFGEVADEEFDRGLQAAVDMASFFETDLDTAIIQVGKAINDPEKGLASLGRIGVQFTDEQKEIIAGLLEVGDTAGAQGIILAELERQFGGAAEAMTETAGGQMAQAMERLGDAGESIGVLLLPVLAQIAETVASVAGWFIELDEGVKGTILTILGILAVVGPILWVGSVVASLVVSVIGGFKAVGAAFGALKLLLLANPFIALAAAVVAIVALIILNWDAIVEFFRGIWKAITTGFSNLGRAIRNVWNGLLEFFGGILDSVAEFGGKLWKPIGTGFKAAIDVIKGIWNAFARWWNSIEIGVPAIDIPYIGRVGGFSVGLPDLPFLAEGGIVNSPTLAVIGEAGPEAVVPLGNGMMGEHHTHIHIENHGPPVEEEDDIVTVLRALTPYLDGRLGSQQGYGNG